MGNKKILIVDDDPDVLQSMHVRLNANHYDTFFASDAKSCMAEVRKSEPDLVILDLGLPTFDGFRVMEGFKALPSLASIPVIVVSGRDPRANQKRAVQAGAKAFLQKPANNAELLAVIRRALGESSPRKEAAGQPPGLAARQEKRGKGALEPEECGPFGSSLEILDSGAASSAARVP